MKLILLADFWKENQSTNHAINRIQLSDFELSFNTFLTAIYCVDKLLYIVNFDGIVL